MKAVIAVALLAVLPVRSPAQTAQTTKRPATSPKPVGEKPLTNADVIAMVKADLGDEIVIAKIEQATKVRLDVSADALIRLKQNGVSKPVIEAIMKRAGQPEGAAAPRAGSASPRESSAPGAATLSSEAAHAPSSPIAILVGNRWQRLEPVTGQPRKKLLMRYADFAGRSAAVRVPASYPRIRIESASDPKNVYCLVRPEVLDAKDTRTLKYEGDARAPDEDFAVPAEFQKQADSSWVVTPAKSLKPGEYGIFTSQGSFLLYGFTVDASASAPVEASGGAPAREPPAASGQAPVAGTQPCVDNLKVEGGFLVGKIYKTYQDFTQVESTKAFSRLLQAITMSKQGWENVRPDRETGIVTANLTISEVLGEGTRPCPLNATVTAQGRSGSRVELLLRIASGVAATEKSVRNEFCRLLAAVGQ